MKRLVLAVLLAHLVPHALGQNCYDLSADWKSPGGWMCSDFRRDRATCDAHVGADQVCCICDGGLRVNEVAPALRSSDVAAYYCQISRLIHSVGCFAQGGCDQFVQPLIEAVHTAGVDQSIYRMAAFLTTILISTNFFQAFSSASSSLATGFMLDSTTLAAICQYIPSYRVAMASASIGCSDVLPNAQCSCLLNEIPTILRVSATPQFAFKIPAWFVAGGASLIRRGTHGCLDLRTYADDGIGTVDCEIVDSEFSQTTPSCSTGFYLFTYCTFGNLGPDAQVEVRIQLYKQILDVLIAPCTSPSANPSPNPNPSASPTPASNSGGKKQSNKLLAIVLPSAAGGLVLCCLGYCCRGSFLKTINQMRAKRSTVAVEKNPPQDNHMIPAQQVAPLPHFTPAPTQNFGWQMAQPQQGLYPSQLSPHFAPQLPSHVPYGVPPPNLNYQPSQIPHGFVPNQRSSWR